MKGHETTVTQLWDKDDSAGLDKKTRSMEDYTRGKAVRGGITRDQIDNDDYDIREEVMEKVVKKIATTATQRSIDELHPAKRNRLIMRIKILLKSLFGRGSLSNSPALLLDSPME